MRKSCIVFALCIVFIFSGCSGTGKNIEKIVKVSGVNSSLPSQAENSPAVSQVSSGEGLSTVSTDTEIKLVRKKEKTKYLLSNGIELSSREIPYKVANEESALQATQISGLKDKNVENKLNKSLFSDIEKSMKDYTAEKDNEPFMLMCTTQINANNLLSVSLNEYYSPPLQGFLYRLTDGQKLYLKDIFTAGTDYIALVNRKVREGILKNSWQEENNLSEPFTTIKPDQDFALGESELFIIFHAGEGGFVNTTSISIPLTEIDDYVDVLDRYSGTERKTHERTDLIVRKNNIFIKSTGKKLKRENGDVWDYYPVISGLRDASFEETINKTIMDSVNEALNSKYIASIPKRLEQSDPSDPIVNRIAEININVAFNYYGILCINRNVYNYNSDNTPSDNDAEKFNTVYSFDLIKKKRIDPKNIIDSYIKKHKELEATFVSLVRSNTNEKFSQIKANFDYSYIMSKGTMFFRQYYLSDSSNIIVCFKKASIEGLQENIECEIPLKSIIKTTPEDFFAS